MQDLLQTNIDCCNDLEKWLMAESSLLMLVNEALMGHYIEYCRDTSHEHNKQRYLHDERIVKPLLNRYQQLFDEKVANSPFIDGISANLKRLITLKRQGLRTMTPQIAPLESREGELIARHNEIKSQFTVMWEGTPQTVYQMRVHLKSSDRVVREKAWRATKEARKMIGDELDEIMDELIRVRHSIAEKAGFKNYVEYQFAKKNRIDYTIADCKRLHEVVREHIIPIYTEIQKNHRYVLGIESYRPWDVYASHGQHSSQNAFADSSELFEGVERMVRRVDHDVADLLIRMRNSELLDMDNRPNKTGTFMAPLHASRTAFLQVNAAGQNLDISTTIHELGHCFHNHQYRHVDHLLYRRPPQEVTELASTGLEYLCLDKYDEFYEEKPRQRAAAFERVRDGLENIVLACLMDKFQHWIYENPHHTKEERHETFNILARYFTHAGIDSHGLQDSLSLEWQELPHLYIVPLYMIEYAFAELAAIQLWNIYASSPEEAIDGYKSALALGNTRGIPEIYTMAGINFDFSKRTVLQCADRLRSIFIERGIA